MHTITERARKCLARMEPAISGSGGRTATFKAALALTKGFSFGAEEALPLFAEWNSTCFPPWSERELRAFLSDAAKSRQPSGYLLRNQRAPISDLADEKRRKRERWPAMFRLTEAEMHRIAALRGITVDAVALVASHGFLWRCQFHEGEECFVIRNGPYGTFAQRRRFDGEACTLWDGSRVKAATLPGAEGAFLYPGGLGNPDVPVLLTEGTISILEAAEAALRAETLEVHALRSVAIAAAVSASSRFTADALCRMQGRRVRIYGDADKAGREAAAHWTASLRSVDCKVENVILPAGCKDLGDALRQVPAGNSYWHQLFTF